MSKTVPASFKDPSGFVYIDKGVILRQVNQFYQQNYDHLMQSGLYNDLIKLQLLINHKEISSTSEKPGAYKIIKPENLPFISYPYEWCFSQLKDAALLTLKIQKMALEKNMSLKDASSFNIQFLRGKPILIDTLSFEIYKNGKPWVAYKQFCEQFLAPLALASYDERLLQLLIPYLGSLPLDLAVKLLPISQKLHPGIIIHLIMHSKGQSKLSDKKISTSKSLSFSKNSLLGLVDSLENTVKNLKLNPATTVWSGYGDNCQASYNSGSLTDKQNLVAEYLKDCKSKYVWDLGANNGNFSRIAAKGGAFTVSMDLDHTAVESNYAKIKEGQLENILPLCINLINPSPAIGWANKERDSLSNRSNPDTILSLALIHHLAIANNLPLDMVAEFFSQRCQNLIIEFVPKSDPQTQILLQNRDDIFDNYTKEGFESIFSKYFLIKKSKLLKSSTRILYLMEKR